MGEKETAGAGNDAAKLAPDKKKDEEQAYVRDDNSEAERTKPMHETSMPAIRNLR